MTAVLPPAPKLIATMQVIFLLTFLVFGTALVHEGRRAIQRHAYTLRYTEQTSWIGPGLGGNSTRENAAEFNGQHAVLFGAGFIAAGIMLFAWAAGLLIGLFAHGSFPRFLVNAIGAVSLAALLTACIALFPPWKLHTLPLYVVVGAFTLAVTLPIPPRWRKSALPAFVVLFFAVGVTTFPSFPLFAGFFVFLVAATNVLVLWPRLAARIEKGRRRSPPRA